MALQELYFDFEVDGYRELPDEWIHTGVVGSGDLEVLMEKKDLAGKTKVKVVTPVTGFDEVWGLVLEKFVNENRVGNVMIEINDNNATPIIVSIRLRQAWQQAQKASEEGQPC